MNTYHLIERKKRRIEGPNNKNSTIEASEEDEADIDKTPNRTHMILNSYREFLKRKII